MKLILILSLTLIFTTSVVAQKKVIDLPDDYYLMGKAHDRYAFFSFDAQRDRNIFNKNSIPASLSKNDLAIIEKLIAVRVADYNKTTRFDLIKHSKKYYKQIIAVINEKGEKEVWVNCCCSVIHEFWKTHIQNTLDGGRCYFNLTINLTKKIIYDFTVNGVA